MQVQIKDIQTQEIIAQGSIDQIKALYEEEEVLDAIDQAIETQETVIVYGFVGNGIEITTTEESSNQMQQQQSPVAQMLMADSKKFECDFSEGDALVIPNNEIAYNKPLFRVTESEIFLLSAEGKIWDQYDMPKDGDVVSYIEDLLSSFGL
jgi:hypothetical protein